MKKLVTRISGRGHADDNRYLSFIATDDSVVVIFDDTIIMVHCGYRDSCNYTPAYSLKSERNIRNENSYKREIKNKRKNHIENVYTYTFTPQDYEDAKE